MDTINNHSTNIDATIDDFCRLCLRNCGSSWMRPWHGCTESESVAISDMLVFCCGLPTNLTDQLPQRVCFPCISRLEQAYSICRTFKEKEIILDRFYSSGSVLKRLAEYNKFRFNVDVKVAEVPVIKSDSSIEDEAISESIPTVVPLLDLQQQEEESVSNQSAENLTTEITLNENLPSKSEPPSDNYSENSLESSIRSMPNLINMKQLYELPEPLAIKTTRKYQMRSKRKKRFPSEPAEDGFFHCIYCPRKFPHRKNFMEHLGIHRAVMEQRYKCHFCGKIFGKNDHLVKHESRHQRKGGLLTN
ncbi:PR domain zinc finger protein 2-like [Aedes aegypti]|uniref:Uncharacterized protein n=1 Tax=Aedes aegypti TaxID=7159 RepID=A0A6I8TN29_AEDAE|nr:PR domain zinc finger protein 2-like [Aedes aegypti]